MTAPAEFTEIADRVWVARFPWYDVNVGLVAGAAGLVVVDTNASADLGRETLTAIRRISHAPVLAAVNTHAHFDHVLGNGVFAAEGAALLAHENTGAAIEDAAHRPTRAFSSALTVDLGDRIAELVHPGRGHTDGDIVVRVAGAGAEPDVVFAGDLVEQSAMPSLGDDCFPMDWPATLDLVLTLIATDAVVVPGHGTPVDRDFVDEQRSALGVVAETIRDLAGRGVPLEDALGAAAWPYPVEELADAVRRGYEHLPRARRQLPLI